VIGTIVVVTYNSADCIGDCLQSLTGAQRSWDIVVVDNASRDDTREIISARFPWARLLAQPANLGLAPAYNLGAAAAKAPLILFLNSDTIVQDGALDRMVAALESTGAAAVVPRLNWPDGRYQRESAERRTPGFSYLALECLLLHRVIWWGGRRGDADTSFDPSLPQFVEQPISAALLVRAALFRELGGFDGRFVPIWFDDTDFCKRLDEAGARIWYVPDAVVVHLRQHSLPLFTATQVRAIWNANLLRYARKHFTDFQSSMLRGAAVVGTVMRGLVQLANPRRFTAGLGHFLLALRMIRYSDESRWYE
jgi:N-acetylglucosaminyl-diphospho-decaprenol L-rhamnosyltransferase